MTSYGLLLPHFGEEADRDKLLKGAQRAEELGFDSVWVRDHLVFEPHGANSKSAKRVEIPLGDIKEVRPAGGKLVRRFEVVTARGTHSFLVENRDAWLTAFAPLLGIVR